MLSPNPLSLFCALLLCLPLAVVFTITTTPPNTTTTGGATTISTTSNTTTNRSGVYPIVPTFTPTIKTQQKNKNTTATSPPPPRPAEEDDDDSLFRLAARVNPKPSPAGSRKKLAFMFLTTTPLPFAPLWELFFNHTPKNLYNIYIHADPRIYYDPPFRGVFDHRVIPSKPTRRYSPTLIAAARRLLSQALLHDPSNSMFALLSASCIPLHSFNFTYKTLIRSKKSFIEILKNEAGAYDRWAARGEGVMLPEVRFESFRIGSQFFVLTRRHARIAVSDRRLWSKFKLPCLKTSTCYPEEHYFPTLMSMKDPRGCVPATLTHVDWKGRHDDHPRTYGAAEVGPNLIMSLRKHRPRYGAVGINGSDSSVRRRRDPFLFARKFSPDSIQPLMSMANDVIFKDQHVNSVNYTNFRRQ
ncbi:glycosyltransferase BC10 [Cornus florida]|uniref:glycosyltransferase BC10 n=1 Tax=Cornus florida TaxID=4283 RepID=UPI00289F71A8|nr:glycosyltransferase BC10 [Cornus florida]